MLDRAETAFQYPLACTALHAAWYRRGRHLRRPRAFGVRRPIRHRRRRSWTCGPKGFLSPGRYTKNAPASRIRTTHLAPSPLVHGGERRSALGARDPHTCPSYVKTRLVAARLSPRPSPLLARVPCAARPERVRPPVKTVGFQGTSYQPEAQATLEAASPSVASVAALTLARGVS